MKMSKFRNDISKSKNITEYYAIGPLSAKEESHDTQSLMKLTKITTLMKPIISDWGFRFGQAS